jgi:hypothetical protein
MAESTKRSPSARPKSSSNPKNGAGKASGSKRSGSSSSRSAAASNRARPSRTTSGSNSRAKSSGSRSSGSRGTAAKSRRSSSGGSARNSSSKGSNGVVQTVTETVGTAGNKAKAPLIAGGAGVAGLIGGLVLGSRALAPRKKVLGVPISRKGFNFKPVAKEIHKAGKQLGRLTDEMAQARKQAQKVGDALS